MNLELGRVTLVVLFAIIPIVGIALGMRAPALRSKIPLLVAFFAGLIPIFSMYIPKKFLSGDDGMSPRLDQWLIIVAGFALLLGITNVVSNGFKKISRRDRGWPYSIVLLIGLFVMGAFGIYAAVSGQGTGILPNGSPTPFRSISLSRTVK